MTNHAEPLLSSMNDAQEERVAAATKRRLCLSLANVSLRVRNRAKKQGEGSERGCCAQEEKRPSPLPSHPTPQQRQQQLHSSQKMTHILANVTAQFESGTVTALLGPSGAGKTSLLSVLGGHAGDWGSISGTVTVNGRELSHAHFRRMGALVPQDDTLLPGLTVRQTLAFGAALRLKAPPAARARRTDALLSLLGLTSCADVLVGASHVGLHGVSGGQRKRTSIALELLADPTLLLLDEPTSGLDSKMAEDVMELLAQIAKGRLSNALEERSSPAIERKAQKLSSSPLYEEARDMPGNGAYSQLGGEEADKSSSGVDDASPHRIVVCTIHQPSFRIFSGFDQIILLARAVTDDPRSPGRIAFMGTAQQLMAHMTAIGLSCPPHENPADHSMRLLQEQQALDKIFREGATAATAAAGSLSATTVEVTNVRSEEHTGFESGAPDKHLDLMVAALGKGAFPIGYGQQFVILLQRFVVDYFRDPKKFAQGLIVRGGIGVVLGVVWYGQAGTTQDSIFPVTGALFACCLNGTMDTVFQTALLIPNMKALLLREFRNGYYALLPMQLALFICNAAAQNLNIVFLAVPVYTLVGLQPSIMRFFIFLAALSCLVWLGVGVGIAVGANATTFQEAQAAIVPLLVPLILFSGYLIPYAQIPYYFKWLYEASFFQHAIAILEINQFSPVDFTDCPFKLKWGSEVDHTAVDPNDPSKSFHYSCAEVSAFIKNETAEHFGNEDDDGLGIISTCANGISVCYDTGKDFLDDMHVNPNSLAFNFYVIIAYIAGALLLGYVLLCRALQTTIFCCHSS